MSDLTSRIRAATFDLRRQKIPLGDLIPMMQEAADRIEADEALMREAIDALKAGIYDINMLGGARQAMPLHEAITALRKRLESSK